MKDYTLGDVGCYVDGSRGIYAVDRIVEITEEHGMETPDNCSDGDCARCAHGCKTAGDGTHSEWALCFWTGEIEDDCDNYMNDHYPVEGAYWGRSEQGDWGLWETAAD
jgi:hypothetical protein